MINLSKRHYFHPPYRSTVISKKTDFANCLHHQSECDFTTSRKYIRPGFRQLLYGSYEYLPPKSCSNRNRRWVESTEDVKTTASCFLRPVASLSRDKSTKGLACDSKMFKGQPSQDIYMCVCVRVCTCIRTYVRTT